jgi:endonuclease/exonuclease/phosphatase family metal-dependent hydrolase
VEKFKLMTFNIRGCFPTNTEANFWENRAELNVATIQKQSPDLIGFQEVQADNLKTYAQHLRGYERHLGPRTIIEEDDAFTMVNAIFWKPERFEAIESGGFYLSKTPEKWSSDWESVFVRGATWVILRCVQSGAELLYVNTHLDHISELARVEGSKLIIDRIKELGREGALPVIVTADFNSRAWQPPDEDVLAYPAPMIGNLLPPGGTVLGIYTEAGFRDAYREAGHVDRLDTNTFHGFYGEQMPPAGLRIDWILLLDGAQSLKAESCQIIRDAEPPVYPSDHYPVTAELVIN